MGALYPAARSLTRVRAAAEAMWNAADPVVKKARPTWAEIEHDPNWRHSVRNTLHDAEVALAAARLSDPVPAGSDELAADLISQAEGLEHAARSLRAMAALYLDKEALD